MATPTSVKSGGVTVDGLTESIKVLGKLDKGYRKEAVAILRVGAKDVAKQSRAQLNRVGRYPSGSPASSIGFSATGKGAGVKLRAHSRPWLLGAEFGEVVAHVYGHPVGQSRFRRRTFGRWKPPTSKDLNKNTGGYIIQPTIRRLLPKIEKQVARDLDELTKRAFRKGGVHGGR